MTKYKTINPKKISQREMHQHLLAAVAPRPICLASTIDLKDRVNLSPFSFFNVFSSNPPILIFSPARRGTDGSIKHTLENLMQVKEVVVNIVNYSMANQMALSSADFPKGENEFNKAGFTPVSSQVIRPPRVAEAPVSFECVVDRIIPLGDNPGAGNLVLAQVILMHVQENLLTKENRLDSTRIDQVARMGGQWYNRLIDKSLFKLSTRIDGTMIGVESLPFSSRNSTVLTGNDLGILGSLSALPDLKNRESALELSAVQAIFKLPIIKQEEAFHRLAQKFLRTGDPQTALSILFLSEEQKSAP